MTEHSPSREGLRARKRAATLAAIEREALRLVLERGYDNVTIEMICDAAMISPRTFFNYVGSKERVVLGTPPSFPTDAEVDAFVHSTSTNILDDLLHLVGKTMTEHALAHERSVMQSRRIILQRTPELASKEQAWIAAHEEQYITIILARFDAQRYEPTTGMTRQSEARLVITLGTALIHYLAGLWPDSIPTDAEAQELTQTAIEAIRRIVWDPLR